MFEDFSQGYYLGQMYVEPHAGDTAMMHRAAHEHANERVHHAETGIARLDSPVVMKLRNRHFPVLPSENIPVDTLAVPDQLLAATGVTDPPTLTEVLLAKHEHAARLLQWFGGSFGDAPGSAH